MGASFAEFVVLAAAVWLIARGLEPLRRRVELWLLRQIAPERAEIIDAQVVPPSKKRKE